MWDPGTFNRRTATGSVIRVMLVGALEAEPLASLFNKINNLTLLPGLEIHRKRGLHRDCSAVHGVGLELPLLHAVDGGSREGQ